MAGISGMGVAAAAGGAVLLWSGIKGAQATSTLRSLLSGQAPKQGNAAPVGTPGSPASSSLTGTGEIPPPGVAAPGGSYSTGALRSLWVLAGGDPGTSATAACIASHESAGNAGAQSANPDGGINVGLWQLDTKGKGAGYTVAQLKDPLTNARVAVRGSGNGTDWSAWATAPMCGVA